MIIALPNTIFFLKYKELIIIIIALSSFTDNFSQKEQHTWYVGRNGAFLDFNSGTTPSVTCLGNLFSDEGSAMYCNPTTGTLLIYTNGQRVHNGNHVVLDNGIGLIGNSSATETAMILPKSCGNNEEFYILTNNLNRVYWSQADLTKGPNGTVDTATKNTLLQTNTGERLGCAPHVNANAGWILLTDTGGYLNAYYIDALGINPTPVKSHTTLFNSNGGERGSIILSEDHTKLVISIEYQGVYYCDFDIATGVASNFQKIPPSFNGYSACFSPDGTKIYWTNGYGQPLYQYNITNGINTFLDNNVSAVKLGPNGIVYSGTYGVSFLGTISSPNTAGTACTYTRNGLSLGGCFGAWNLPNQSINIAELNMTTSNDTLVCPGSPVTISAFSGNLSYNWDQGLGAGASHVVSPLLTTVYHVTGIDTSGCTILDSVTVNIGDTINPTPRCKDTTIYLDLSGNFTIDSSYVDDSTYDNCAITEIYLSKYSFDCSDVGTSTITLYAYDAIGNTDSCTANITVVDSFPPAAICQDTTIYLDANGNYTIDSSYINNNSTDICGIATITLNKYQFTCADIGINLVTMYVTDINGNVDSCSANVTVFDTIKPIVNCMDTTIYLDTGGIYVIDSSYVNNNSTDNCGIYTILPSKNTFNCSDIGSNLITLYVTDVNGNVDSCTATVWVNDSSTFNAYAGADDSLCQVFNYTMNANPVSPYALGMWSQISGPVAATINTPTLHNTTISGLINGIFEFEWIVSSISGCSIIRDTVMISVFNIPIISAGSDTILCGEYSLNLNAGNTSGNGSWSYLSPAPSIPVFSNITSPTSNVSNLGEGVYSLVWTVTNGNCIVEYDTIIITIYDSSFANIGVDMQLCDLDSTILVANALTPYANGNWVAISGPTIPSFSSTTTAATNITGLLAGTYFIKWTVTNGICPSDVDTIQIDIFDQPISTAGSDTNLCAQYSYILNGNPPIPTITGFWSVDPSTTPPSIPNFSDTTQHNAQISNLVEGQYTLIWTLSNGNCTPSIDTVILNVWDIPTVNAGSDTTLCATYAYQFNAITSGSLYQGLWRLDTTFANPNIPNIVNPTQPNAAVYSLMEGTYQFIWEVSNGPCFIVYDTISITIYDQPISVAGPNQDLCNQATTIINAIPTTGTSSGQWYLASSTPNTPIFNSNTNSTSITGMLEGGIYSFYWEVTNGICPSHRDTLTIFNHYIPDADFSEDSTIICSGKCIQFMDSSSIHPSETITSYYWDFGFTNSNARDPYECWYYPGAYPITHIVQSSFGCSDTITKFDYVQVKTTPIADFNVFLVDDVSVSTKIQVQDNSTNSNTYHYTFGDGTDSYDQNPSHIYADSGFYDVTQIVSNNDGCSDTFTRTIFVHVLLVYVPNTITPNGDGLNDNINPSVLGDDPSAYLFRVFDRWGNMIFQTQSQSEGWDGTYKDNSCATGVYNWEVRAKYKDGERINKYRGHVTLLR